MYRLLVLVYVLRAHRREEFLPIPNNKGIPTNSKQRMPTIFIFV